MSPSELAWRLGSASRNVFDKYRFAAGWRPHSKFIEGYFFKNDQPTKPRLSDIGLGEWAGDDAEPTEAAWLGRLLDRANRIVAHKLSFFNYQDLDLGSPMDWNRDHVFGKSTPMDFAQSIDYRDFNIVGDCKIVWEPGRCCHLVVLGRAYRSSGQIKYAKEVIDQLNSWLEQCPFGKGMHWRSPLELAIRLINWVWALDLISDSELMDEGFREKILASVHQHLWEVSRKFSKGSSANNHLIGEAAGVFIGASYFKELADSKRWREKSRKILEAQIIEQTYADGCNKEQALGYHLFVIQFFLYAGLIARADGDDFSPRYLTTLEKMFEFLGPLTDGGSSLPFFGDCDDGYVLDLAGEPKNLAFDLLSIAAVIFDRTDFKAQVGSCSEAACWALRKKELARFNKIDTLSPARQLASKAFPASGYYLLQCGTANAADRISVLFDCGELGYKSIAAHGHADALSFSLRVFGVDVFVDPGTYDYFSYGDWRDYFRSTRAHNTLMVDGADQSAMLGSFMWGKRATARCLSWEADANGAKVVGEHNGYAKLRDPVIHRRSLSLDAETRKITLLDEIEAKGEHRIEIFFHLAETCSIAESHGNTLIIDVGPGTVSLEIDERLEISILRGSKEPKCGWVSRAYHHKTASAAILCRGIVDGGDSFKSFILGGCPRIEQCVGSSRIGHSSSCEAPGGKGVAFAPASARTLPVSEAE